MRIFAGLLILAAAAPLPAQRPDSGAVAITIKESMGMLGDFIVRSGTRATRSDARGQARLVLPVGQQTINVSKVGFTPKSVVVRVVRDSTVAVTVETVMGEMAEMLKEVTISATRIEKLAGDTPTR